MARHSFLIKQGTDYYNINSNYQLLGASTDATQLEKWYNLYGADDINVITQNLSSKKVPLIQDEVTKVWSCELDANDILGNIQQVAQNNTRKLVQYDCVTPYRILDKLENQFEVRLEVFNS